MKKILFSLLGALFTFGVAQAQTLSIDDVQVIPGGTASFELKLNVGSGAYTGFQARMIFPETGFSITGNTTVLSQWTGGGISVGDLVGGSANIAAISTSDVQIPSGDIVIGSIEFKADDNLAKGEYQVTISGFDFLDGTNYTHANNGEDVTFKIKVVDPVVLDEDATEAPGASDGKVIALVKRSIKANVWSTICLPFAMTATQVKEAFGDDVKIADFRECESNDYANITEVTVKFESTDNIKANHPYIIKVANDITSFTINGVIIAPDEANAKVENLYRRVPISGFYGTYHAGTEIPKLCLFMSEGKFWYATENSKTMKGYRGYFNFYDDVLKDVADAYSPAPVKIAIDIDGSETSIKVIDNEGIQTGEAYDLSGRKVSKPQQSGIYIIDGKKVAVK